MVIALLFLAPAVAATASRAGHESSDPHAAQCGGQLWRLKTLSDAGRKSVQLTPRSTTIAALRELPNPRPIPRKRRTAFQRQTWEVVAQLTDYRLETGGARLVLYDGGAYINAVIPVPSCLVRPSRARADIAATWKQFAEKCARPTRDWQSLGAIAYVRGVGFWSQRRTERGAAPNGAELHPVTGLRIVAGCRR